MATRLRNAAKGAAVLTVVGTLTVQTVGGFEGLRLYAYQDVIGVWTACYGETKGIKPGMKFSKTDCNNMLVDSLIEHEQGMRTCLKNPDGLPTKVYVADLSLTYNIGVGGFCRSTIARKQNAGQIRESCNFFPLFNRGGGRVIAGLIKRRAAEQKLCNEGAA
ncbi:lysozyme [Oryzifoliimicrobium ureilyticus]|uniref:lysozyme n=1 Tax=Oryzifoliimicrobium ureilyticus TaxID=3113724 RepID=UPI003075F3D5